MIPRAKFIQLAGGPSVLSGFVTPALFALDGDGQVWEFIKARDETRAVWRPLPMERES